MTNAMTLKEKIGGTREMLAKLQQQIARALPSHMTAERMIRVVETAAQRTPELLDCSPRSLAAAVIQCSELGLEPSSALGHAYLLPFNNRKTGHKEVQVIIGYKGLLDLARRSGEISTIAAFVVRERDEYDYRLGLNPTIFHRPYKGVDGGDVVAVYAIAVLKDGGKQFEWMWREQIDMIRDMSKAGKYGPWVSHWEEMAKKTVLRRLSKLLPCSIEMHRAVVNDEMAEVGRPQEIDLGALDPVAFGDESAAESELDALAETIQGSGSDE